MLTREEWQTLALMAAVVIVVFVVAYLRDGQWW